MKNDYEIRGDITIINLNVIDGVQMTTVIDTDDLNSLLNFDVLWYAHFDKRAKYYYVRASVKNRNLRKTYLLHRVLTNAPRGLVVDHFDGNPLNNRRNANLKIVTHGENIQNTKKQKNNTSGERGVIWVKRDKRWKAVLQFNGKYVLQKNCTSYDEAVSVIREARSKYFNNCNENR